VSKARHARVERLVDLRARSLEDSERIFAAARAATQLAEHRAKEAADAFEARANAHAEEVIIGDHAAARAYLETLGSRADAARRAVALVRLEEDHARAATLAAQQELKKVELWRDHIALTIREEAARQDRRETDAIAARQTAEQARELAETRASHRPAGDGR
jgi:flagellar export protein FliJ